MTAGLAYFARGDNIYKAEGTGTSIVRPSGNPKRLEVLVQNQLKPGGFKMDLVHRVTVSFSQSSSMPWLTHLPKMNHMGSSAFIELKRDTGRCLRLFGVIIQSSD